nr:SDR family oxidoreductase [Streptomyces griseicoloratus]
MGRARRVRARLPGSLPGDVPDIRPTARRKPELERVAKDITADGGNVLAIQADTTNGEEIQRAVAAAVEEWGRLDGALNNAGRSQGGGRLAEVTDETFDSVLETNFKGVWLAMRAELQAMTAQGTAGGSIVNISSIGGTFGATGQSVYGATKAAVIAMSRAAAAEYGRDGVRVNSVAPGSTMTEMMIAWQQRDPGIIEHLSSLAALGHPGQPRDRRSRRLAPQRPRELRHRHGPRRRRRHRPWPH